MNDATLPDELTELPELPDPPAKPRLRVFFPLAFWSALLGALAYLAWWRVEILGSLSDQGFFAKYTFFAQKIIDGEIPAHRLGDLSPGYLWSVVGLIGPGGLDSLELRAIQVGIVSLVALLCAVAANRLWGRLAGLVAAAAIMTSRAALLNAAEIEPEALVLLLNAAALASLVVFRGRAGQFLTGLLLGLSVVTRPTALLAVLAVGLWVWRMMAAGENRSWRVVRSLPLVLILGVVAPVAALKLAYATIPGVDTLMNPGTVFFEGMNPATTGLAGDAPAVVKGVESGIDEPDALHEAYRLVASRALQSDGTGVATNLFWWQRSRAFVVAYPEAAARVLGRKVLLALSSHDAWDLETTARKERELDRPEWAPFGLLLALAAAGLVLIREEEVSGLLISYLGCYFLVMVVFYVTARQRNPLLPVLALLAGAAAHHLVELLRNKRVLALFGAAASIAVMTFAAGIDGRAQSEDRHTWDLVFKADKANVLAQEAESNGDHGDARRWRAAGVLWRGEPIAVAEARLGLEVIHEVSEGEGGDAERFDLALAMMAAGRWSDAGRLLEKLDETGYRPLRGVVATPSIAFQRARCMLRTGAEESVGALLDRALVEAPGDADVLALRAAAAMQQGEDDLAAAEDARLGTLHDPFSADLARAAAAADVGDLETRRALLEGLRKTMPEWLRPARLLQVSASG